MSNQKIISPCISICKSDSKTGQCYGCARTDEEKKIWKNPNTKNKLNKYKIDKNSIVSAVKKVIKKKANWVYNEK